MEVILYNNHCKYSKKIIKKLEKAKIDYVDCTDMNIINRKNFDKLPILEISDNNYLDYEQTLIWLEKRMNNEDNKT